MILEVDGLGVRFRLGAGGRDGVVSAVTDVSFPLGPGRLLTLVGESGCGKSVLAAAIMGLLPANAETVRALRPHDPDPQATVRALADRVRLPAAMLARYPHELSGGTAQRVGVAAALAGDPPVLLADEPTAGLDRPLVDSTVDLLAELAAAGHAVLLITHDLRAARRVATDIAVMYAGRVLEMGPAHPVLTDPWHPYTEALVDALPGRGFTPPPGHPPELTAPPPGCGFEARCPDRHACSPDPALRAYGDRWLACADPPAAEPC